MVIAVLLDSTLNPVFILGLGPAPRMGIAGSATATVIANAVGLTAMIAYIYARDLPLRLLWPYLSDRRPDCPTLRLFLTKGFPMWLPMVVISVAALVMIG